MGGSVVLEAPEGDEVGEVRFGADSRWSVRGWDCEEGT